MEIQSRHVSRGNQYSYFVGEEGSRGDAVRELRGIKRGLNGEENSTENGNQRRSYLVGTAGIGKTEVIKYVFGADFKIFRIDVNKPISSIAEEIDKMGGYESLLESEVDKDLLLECDKTISDLNPEEENYSNILDSLVALIKESGFEEKIVVIIEGNLFLGELPTEINDVISALHDNIDVGYVFEEYIGEKTHKSRYTAKVDSSEDEDDLCGTKILPFRPSEVEKFICGGSPSYCLLKPGNNSCPIKKVIVREILQRVGCHPGMLASVRSRLTDIYENEAIELGLASEEGRDKLLEQSFLAAKEELLSYIKRLLSVAKLTKREMYEQLSQWVQDSEKAPHSSSYLDRLIPLSLAVQSRPEEGWKTDGFELEFFYSEDSISWWIPNEIKNYIKKHLKSTIGGKEEDKKVPCKHTEVLEWLDDSREVIEIGYLNKFLLSDHLSDEEIERLAVTIPKPFKIELDGSNKPSKISDLTNYLVANSKELKVFKENMQEIAKKKGLL